MHISAHYFVQVLKPLAQITVVIDQWEKIQVDKESSMDWLVRPYQGPLIGGANVIITSRVSGRGYRIGAYSVLICDNRENDIMEARILTMTNQKNRLLLYYF